MPHLVVRRPGRMPFSIPLHGEVRLGRHEQNDICLDDPQVSRHHMIIGPLPGGEDRWQAQDLGSRHGTRVNGQPVSTVRLAAGDHIQLGSVILSLHVDDEDAIVHHQVTSTDAPPPMALAYSRLRLIYETSRAIGALDDPDTMLAELLDTVADVLGCERALAGLGDRTQGIVRRVCRTRGGGRPDEIIVSRAVVDATLGRREAVIIRNARSDSVSRTIIRERILSAMAVPLGLGAQPIGLLYVDDRREPDRFSAPDLDFLTVLGHLVSAAIENAERVQRAEAMAEALSAGVTADIVGQSPEALRLKAQIVKYAAAARANVLIRGESGSGKELVARALHMASPRSSRPFVTLNCAAIPDAMVESELFGYEKGAFTGATGRKRGKFVLADGGTLFLDEIGDLSLAAQAKLLRAIQEGEIQPLGSERSQRVDVRCVCATHKDLQAEIAAGRFREDLYYRFNVVQIGVPPLRERGQDVVLLAHTLAARTAAEMGKRVEGLTGAAIAALLRHSWPGNVRELKNEIERAVIDTEGPLIDAHDLSLRLGAGRVEPGPPRATSLAERFAALEPMERQIVEEALAQARGNLSEAARLLGTSRIVIRRRVARFGLGSKDEPSYPGDADDID